MTRPGWWLLALVLLVTGATFAPAVGYEFVYDDHPVIEDNPTLTDPMQIVRGFGENVWAFSPADTRPIYYRPVFMAWVTVHRLLFDVNPAPWHASTILLHLLATAILFGLVLRLSGSLGVAAAGSLLWAVHPTRVESVAWVLGNTDPMAAVLGFGAVWLWVDGRKKPALASFAAALLCKETSLGFAALPVLLAAFGGDPRSLRLRAVEGARTAIPWAAVVVLYFVVRYSVMGALAPGFTDADVPTAGRTVITLVGLYAKKLVIPGTSSLLYRVGPVTSSSDPVFIDALPWAFLATAAFAFLLSRRGVVAALTVCGLVFLIPVLRVKGLQADAFFQDRYLYLPSACLIPALCWTMGDLFRRMRPEGGAPPGFVQLRLPALLAAVLVVFGVLGCRRNLPAWENDVTLWTRALSVTPTASRAWVNLGVLHENRGDLPAAYDAYLRAAAGTPPRAIGAFRAAILDAEAGHLDAARRGFAQAVQMRPEDPMFLYERARLEAHFGAWRLADELLQRADEAMASGVVAGRGITRETVAAERARVRARRAKEASPP
jgi:hypothetical protein